MDTDNLLDNKEGESAPTPMETDATTPPVAPVTPAVPAPTTVEATASGNKEAGGYNSLLNFNGYKPREDWRNKRRSGW